LGWRAAGDGADRLPGAADAREPQRCRERGRGIVRRGNARLAAFHAARGVARSAGAGRAALGQPRVDPPLAAQAGARTHVGAAPGADRGTIALGRGSADAGRIPPRAAGGPGAAVTTNRVHPREPGLWRDTKGKSDGPDPD